MSPTCWACGKVARALEVFARDIAGQDMLFTEHQRYVQRILLILALCGLITLTISGLYTLLAIDPRKLIFRHQLIFFLLFFDLVKAIVLLIFPARVIQYTLLYDNTKFCQAAGFFTALAIEGADIAIFAFAIHTFLLIFYPRLLTRVKNAVVPRSEGGLYRYRWGVYALSFFVPVLMASLAFIHPDGYQPFVCWCYLPQKPVWYRLVLLWVPRYVILVCIIVIYILIYVHVIREFKTLGGVFSTLHRSNVGMNASSKPLLWEAIRYLGRQIKNHLYPTFVLPSDDDLAIPMTPRHTQKDEDEEDLTSTSTPVHVDTENIVYNKSFHQTNLENFRKRQRVIEKQMKLIFVYPFAYMFIWLFPFILQATQINYEEEHGPIVWLNGLGAFMQPLPGFIDTLVFFYREQPWKYTVMQTVKREHKRRMDLMVLLNRESGLHPTIPTGAVAQQEYLWWRRLGSRLRLPLFALPTDEDVQDLTTQYVERMEAESERPKPPLEPIVAGHDFSSVLKDDGDFRSQLELFALDFGPQTLPQDRRLGLPLDRHLEALLNPRKLSVVLYLTRSQKSRRFSIADMLEPRRSGPTTRRGSHTGPTQIRKSLVDEMDLIDFLRKGPA